MPSHLEFEAKAVDKAVQKASEALNIPVEKLQYNVISYGSSGIFGLVGVKKAKIAVILPDGANGTPNGRSRSPKGGKLDPATREKISSLVAETFEEADAAEQKARSKSSRKPRRKSAGAEPRENRSSEEGDSRRGSAKSRRPAADAPPSEPLPEEALETPNEDADDLEDIADISSLDDAENMPFEDMPEESEEDAPGEPIDIPDEVVEQGREFLARIVDAINTGSQVTVDKRPDRILYRVDGGEAGVLIGKKGQTLEAIQYLVEKVVNKKNDARIRVQVDVEGYLDTRKATLRNLALKMAEKTRQTGRPSSMGQMNAHDRRIVHLALKDHPGVRTQSVGEGFYRKLIIFPKKKEKMTATSP